MPVIALAVTTPIVIPLTYGSDFEMLVGVKNIMEKSVRKMARENFFVQKKGIWMITEWLYKYRSFLLYL